jgi:cytochrome d ubiquinol oxidase subunit II
MELEFLQGLWFVLITVLFTGFFFLEGFDYGVGMLLPFLGKSDTERRMIINTIGPVWDGNEVWMITAGGAMFAAFPQWYATLFSGFYIPLTLMLLALIVRGVAFEFRSKDESPRWRSVWDWGIFFGSAIPALLWGVALVNIVRGVPIDGSMTYVGGFFNLLNPSALIGGLASLSVFLLHGAVFLTLKLGSGMEERARKAALGIWVPASVLLIAFVVVGYLDLGFLSRLGGVNPGVIPIAAVAALVATRWLLKSGRTGWAFVLTGAAIVFSTVTLFVALFPEVMPSSLDPAYSLTIRNASASELTLKIMSIVAVALVPVVLAYQSWTYWIFRKRITMETELEY